MFATLSGLLLCQDLVLSSVTTETLPVSTSHVHGIAKSVTVALGVSSVLVSGLACGSGARAPLWPMLPSTDTRVVSVVLRVIVLRSTYNCASIRGHRTALITAWSPGLEHGAQQPQTDRVQLQYVVVAEWLEHGAQQLQSDRVQLQYVVVRTLSDPARTNKTRRQTLVGVDCVSAVVSESVSDLP